MQFLAAAGETIEYISIQDPAVDQEASDLIKYTLTLDQSHLVIRDGMEPIRYTLAGLDGRQRMDCRGQDNSGVAQYRAAAYGVRSAKGLPEEVELVRKGGKLTDKTMDFFPTLLTEELGTRVMILSNVPLELAKN